MQFITERTVVRFPEKRDADDIYRNNAQDPEVTKYLVWKPHTCLQQTVDLVDYCIISRIHRATASCIRS